MLYDGSSYIGKITLIQAVDTTKRCPSYMCVLWSTW